MDYLGQVVIVDTVTDTETYGIVVALTADVAKVAVMWLADEPTVIEVLPSDIKHRATAGEIEDVMREMPNAFRQLVECALDYLLTAEE